MGPALLLKSHRGWKPLSGFALLLSCVLAPGAGSALATGIAAICADGSLYGGPHLEGACVGHGGVRSHREIGRRSTAVLSPAPAPAQVGEFSAAERGRFAADHSVVLPCRDGSIFRGRTRSGACSGHGGIDREAERAQAAGTPAPAVTGVLPAAQESGPEPGQVWVNRATGIYHCPGSRHYGQTRDGGYLHLVQAEQAGYRPARGQPCRP